MSLIIGNGGALGGTTFFFAVCIDLMKLSQKVVPIKTFSGKVITPWFKYHKEFIQSYVQSYLAKGLHMSFRCATYHETSTWVHMFTHIVGQYVLVYQ